MDNGAGLPFFLGQLGIMMAGNGLDQLIGQVPALGKPASHLGMIKAQNLLFRLKPGDFFLLGQFGDHFVLFRQLHLDGDLADIMDKPGSADLFRILHPQVPGQHVAHHGATQGMLPKLHILRLHDLKDGGADDQTLDNIKAQEDDGAV